MHLVGVADGRDGINMGADWAVTVMPGVVTES